MTRGVSSAYFDRLQEDSVTVVELIELVGSTRQWYWTTANHTIVSSDQTYDPFPGRSGKGLEESIDLGISVIDFVIANSGGDFDLLLDTNNLDFADLSIRRIFPDTPDLDSMNIFKGRLGDFSYDRRMVSGQARNAFNGVQIKWPYYTYMDQCAWRFGSTGCSFDTSSITITNSLLLDVDRLAVSVNSGTLTQSYSNDYFTKGRITFLDGINSGEVRTIRAHSGEVLELSHELPSSVAAGAGFDLYPGCRHRLIEDCLSKYNNSSNFLGFPWIPRQEQAF